jgi:hypothetical protein
VESLQSHCTANLIEQREVQFETNLIIHFVSLKDVSFEKRFQSIVNAALWPSASGKHAVGIPEKPFSGVGVNLIAIGICANHIGKNERCVSSKLTNEVSIESPAANATSSTTKQ